MRIVHLSDLHASLDEDFGQRRVAAALIEDVGARHAEQPVDLVVFSGDLANSGTDEELLLGHDLVIEPLISALDTTYDRLIIAPGNHDVSRRLINPYEEEGLRATLDNEQPVTELLSDPDAVSRANIRLSRWLEYTKTVLGHEKTVAGGLAMVSQVACADGRTVGAVALNSAWRCSGAADERHLVIGEFQVASALSAVEGCDLRLVTVHHPLDWLERFDEVAVRHELDRHDVLLCCGHLHEPEPSEEVRRGHAIYSRAGCLYEHRTFHNGYSIVDIDEDGTVVISMRTWWPDRGMFDQATNIAKGGLFVAHWPSRAQVSTLPPASDVLARLADIAQGTTFLDIAADASPSPLLGDLLVQPRLLPLPYSDALAAKRVEDEYKVEPVSPWNPVWREAGVVLVAGGAESGVTSALLWLLGNSYESDEHLLPIYVPFDGLFSARKLEAAIEAAARAAGWSGQRKSLPPLLIAFDDVTLQGRGMDTVLAFLKAHPEHRALFGCREENHDALAKQLDSEQIQHTSAFLGPFGRLQLRTLVEKVAGVGAQDVIDTVFHVVDEQELPRTPFILTALVAVTITVNPSDLASLSASDLLLLFVSLLLGREDVQGTDSLGMDHRSREYLLASYGEALTRNEVETMSRREAEEYVAGWFKARGWGDGTSPGRVLDSFIKRKILVEDAGKRVGFRQPALKHLFTAKWLVEDEGFRNFILEAPLEYPDILLHAASLQRSSKALLVAVHEATKALVSERLADIPLFDEVSNQTGWSNFRPEPRDLERVVNQEPEEPQLPNAREQDARLDAIHEQQVANASTEDRQGAVLTLQEGALAHAVFILTSVLRSSELVDDVGLKKSVFHTTILGWALMIAYASTSGEATALREYLLREDDEETSDEELERMMRLVIVVNMLMDVQNELGTLQLARIVDEMTREGDLMEESAPALLMILLYFAAHRGGAVHQMRELYEAHDGHPIITIVVRAWAHWAYEHEEKPDTRNRLEALLVDMFLGEDGDRLRGQERTFQREQIARNLRKLRLRRLARRRERGGGLDELDGSPADAGPQPRPDTTLPR